MTRPLNHMRMFLAPDELRPFVVDWPDVAAALMARARHEAMAAPLDLALQSTWRELAEAAGCRGPAAQRKRSARSVVRGAPEKGRYQHRLDRRGADAGDAAGRTLQELRVEMFMPADEASEALLVKLGR